jgi:aspartyl-tRNA(Asn)/glutamyl-tRNA(Gln) amidotransferase subunit B
MVEKNILNNLSAKQVLTFMFDTGAAPEIIVKEKNLAQISDSKELEQIIETVIKENQNSINDYSQGKTNALMFLVGQVMRLSKGKANPKVVAELLENKINGGKT